MRRARRLTLPLLLIALAADPANAGGRARGRRRPTLRSAATRARRAVLAPEAPAGLQARRARRPRSAAQGPSRPPPLALYFAQLSDFQLADEESPARAEALDVAGTPLTSAWRPQEALEPFTVDQVVRQVNRFDASPLRNRGRRRARLALTITTGDSVDNQQINETR